MGMGQAVPAFVAEKAPLRAGPSHALFEGLLGGKQGAGSKVSITLRWGSIIKGCHAQVTLARYIQTNNPMDMPNRVKARVTGA